MADTVLFIQRRGIDVRRLHRVKSDRMMLDYRFVRVYSYGGTCRRDIILRQRGVESGLLASNILSYRADICAGHAPAASAVSRAVAFQTTPKPQVQAG